MRKFIMLAILVMLTATSASAKSADPNFSAARFSAAIGVKHDWANEFRSDGWEQSFEKVGWYVTLPVTYRLTSNVYLTGSAEKALAARDFNFSLGCNWRFIGAGRSTWNK